MSDPDKILPINPINGTTNTNTNTINTNIKDLFPAHSRKIDILEQRIFGSTALSNGSVETDEKVEEEILEDSDDDNQFVTSVNKVTLEEPPKQTLATPKGSRDASHKYGRFSQEEDKKILEGHAKFGNKWDEIVRWGNLERSSSQISSRFSRICKTSKDEDKLSLSNSKGALEVEEQPPAKQRRLDSNGTPPIASTLTAPMLSTAPTSFAPSGPSMPTSTIVPVALSAKEGSSSEPLQGEGGKSTDLAAQAERERLLIVEQTLRERETRLKEWEGKLKDWEWKLQQKGAEEQGRAAETVRQQLVQRTKAERALARKKLAEDCHRLGQISFERRGMGDTHEVWQDGELFHHVDEQLRVLGARREQLENTKKQLAKRRQSTASVSSDGNVELASAGDMEEICKVRIMAVKREEAILQEERERLQSLKMLHMKELKRVQDEDQSRFNDFPVLHDSRYLLLSLLGKGGFSEVYHAFDLKELREVACKIHSVNSLWSAAKRQNYTKHAVREYKIHKELVHPKVVRLYDVFEIDANSFCTVLEYCEGGDMDSYLKQHKSLPEREAKCIIAQIFSGLKYLNSQKRPIIHYDLKPGNILFQTNGEVKITDFGLSKIVEEDSEFVELTSQGAGTYWYLPPECFEAGQHPPRISSKVDVWSVGVIFYQLLYGKKPFGNDMSQQKFLSENIAIQTSKLEFPNKPVVTKEAKDFVIKCLTHKHENRPDVQACSSDPFLYRPRQKKPGSSSLPSSISISSMPPPKASKRKIDPE